MVEDRSITHGDASITYDVRRARRRLRHDVDRRMLRASKRGYCVHYAATMAVVEAESPRRCERVGPTEVIRNERPPGSRCTSRVSSGSPLTQAALRERLAGSGFRSAVGRWLDTAGCMRALSR